MFYEMEVEGLGEDVVQEKYELLDKLGDLSCHVNAYSAAIQFYGQLVSSLFPHKSAFVS